MVFYLWLHHDIVYYDDILSKWEIRFQKIYIKFRFNDFYASNCLFPPLGIQLTQEMDHLERASYLGDSGMCQRIVFINIVILLVLLTLTLIYFMSSSSPPAMNHLPQPHPTKMLYTDTCPICLDDPTFPVQTDCCHVFCVLCFLTCWDHGESLFSPILCPMCRQSVSHVNLHFNEVEVACLDRERSQLVEKIRSYNRRFGGEPRPWREYFYDLPILIGLFMMETYSSGTF